jgi:hypothetical protein
MVSATVLFKYGGLSNPASWLLSAMAGVAIYGFSKCGATSLVVNQLSGMRILNERIVVLGVSTYTCVIGLANILLLVLVVSVTAGLTGNYEAGERIFCQLKKTICISNPISIASALPPSREQRGRALASLNAVYGEDSREYMHFENSNPKHY